MLFNFKSQFNKVAEITVPAAEAGNSVVLIDILPDSDFQSEVWGINWGATVLAAADLGTFQNQYVAAHLDFPFDPVNPGAAFFSRSGPDITSGELIYHNQRSTPGTQYDDFAQPFLIQPARRLTVYCVIPLLTAPAAGAILVHLMVRGQKSPVDKTFRLGNLTAR